MVFTRGKFKMVEQVLTDLADAIGRMSLAKVPPPNLCSGPNINDFFDSYERFIFSNYGSDVDIQRQLLPQYLSGEPRDIVNAYGSDGTYRDIKAKLVALFAPDIASRGSAYSEFSSASRKANETLRCFAIRLENLVSKVDASREGREVLLKSKFINSLAPDVGDKLKVQLSHVDRVTLDTLVKVASTLEYVDRKDNNCFDSA